MHRKAIEIHVCPCITNMQQNDPSHVLILQSYLVLNLEPSAASLLEQKMAFFVQKKIWKKDFCKHLTLISNY